MARTVPQNQTADLLATITDYVTNPVAGLTYTDVLVQYSKDGAAFQTKAIAPIAAVITSGNAGTYALVDGQTLTVAVDGGGVLTATFNTVDFLDIANATTAEVAAVITTDITGATAADVGGSIVITSATTGGTSSIEVTGGTANTALGFSTTAVTGTTFWTELGSGVYEITFTSTELDTIGNFVYKVTSVRSEQFVDLAEVTADVTVEPTASVETCAVSGFVYDLNGDPLSNVNVSARIIDTPYAQSPVAFSDSLVNARTASNGYFSFDLVRMALVDITVPDIQFRTQLSVPNLATLDLFSYVDTGDVGPLAVDFTYLVDQDDRWFTNFTPIVSNDQHGITSYVWSFGDGNASNEESPRHEYTEYGSFLTGDSPIVHTVTLTVVDSAGHTATVSKSTVAGAIKLESGILWEGSVNLTYNETVAFFWVDLPTLNPTNPNNQYFELRAGDIGTPQDLNCYMWDADNTSATEAQYSSTGYIDQSAIGLGGGNTYDHEGIMFMYFYMDGPDPITRQLTYIKVGPLAVAPSFTYTPNGLTAQFNNTSADGQRNTIVSQEWDFGDGATSSLLSPAHVYEAAGTYTVALTVTDSEGVEFTYSDSTVRVSVVDLPVPDMHLSWEAWDLTSVTVQFTDYTFAPMSEVVSWEWDFGDGSAVSTEQHPLHVYTTAGNMDVSLTVTDTYGESVTLVQESFTKIELNYTSGTVIVDGVNNGPASGTGFDADYYIDVPPGTRSIAVMAESAGSNIEAILMYRQPPSVEEDVVDGSVGYEWTNVARTLIRDPRPGRWWFCVGYEWGAWTADDFRVDLDAPTIDLVESLRINPDLALTNTTQLAVHLRGSETLQLAAGRTLVSCDWLINNVPYVGLDQDIIVANPSGYDYMYATLIDDAGVEGRCYVRHSPRYYETSRMTFYDQDKAVPYWELTNGLTFITTVNAGSAENITYHYFDVPEGAVDLYISSVNGYHVGDPSNGDRFSLYVRRHLFPQNGDTPYNLYNHDRKDTANFYAFESNPKPGRYFLTIRDTGSGWEDIKLTVGWRKPPLVPPPA